MSIISGDISLSDLVDKNILQEIQDKFSQATGMGSIIVDAHGEPITDHSCFTPFCKFIRDNSVGGCRCRASDAELGEKASKTGKFEINQCHAGLIDIASPIIVNDVHIATVLCGQVLSEEYCPGRNDEFLSRLAEELDVDKTELINLRSKVNVISYDKIIKAADLLHIISNYIVDMGLNYLDELLINEIKMTVVEEQKARLELERVLRLTELKSLQAQVNPHFLFNSLNTIARLAKLEGAEKTEEAAFVLSDFLRHSLRKSGKLVTVREEVEHIKNYLQIQNLRFSDRIQSKINVDEEIMDMLVPVMTLQPLVENAFLHGLSNVISDGLVTVEGHYEQGQMVLAVIDNGCGMDKEKIDEIMEEINSIVNIDKMNGIGISNIYKQMNFYFGSAFRFEIVSEVGQGTKIILGIDQNRSSEEAQ
jgi:two-component system, LytTR family, sensor kinase